MVKKPYFKDMGKQTFSPTHIIVFESAGVSLPKEGEERFSTDKIRYLQDPELKKLKFYQNCGM